MKIPLSFIEQFDHKDHSKGPWHRVILLIKGMAVSFSFYDCDIEQHNAHAEECRFADFEFHTKKKSRVLNTYYDSSFICFDNYEIPDDLIGLISFNKLDGHIYYTLNEQYYPIVFALYYKLMDEHSIYKK